MVDTDIDSPLESVIQTLQTSCNEVSIATTLVYIEENSDKLIVSMEGLFEMLTALQSIVDFTVRRTGESSDPFVSDSMKAHALTTYTSLVIQFGEWSFPIRTNFIKALVEMVCRRFIKKRDYVISNLRSTACECLKELELSFQGEVIQCLKLGPWLENPLSPPPPIVEAVQEEQLACFENYARLFLTCCCESTQSVHPKSVMKIVSLTLDAIETCSPWFRLEIARRLSSAAFIRESEDSSSLWTWAVVHHHFSRLLDSADPHQVHAFWIAAKSFVSDWEREFSDRLVGRIYDFIADPAMPIPVKQICVYWLCEMLNDYYLQYSVYQRKDRLLAGRSAAAHALVEVELQVVLRYCAAFRAIPKSILNCVSADYLDTPNKVGVAFRFVIRVLMSFSPTEESSMFGIPEFLNDLLASTARLDLYMASVISLLSIFSNSSAAPPHVLMRLLQTVGEFVCGVQPPSKTLVYFPLLAFLACETRSDPQVVISALSRFLVATEAISWSDGLRVLELVRLLTLTHIASHAKLAELLGLIKKSVTHVDIQDRASMYSRFLRDSSGIDRSRFLSCNHKPSVLETKHSGCSSTKSFVRRAPSVSEVVTSRILFERNLRPRKALGILDNNWAVFDDRSKLVLPFTLRFNTEMMLDSDFPSKLYGIELSFSISESFQPFQPVELPFLTCGVGQSFPFMYEISLELIPVEPQPAVFDVQVIFTDQEGVCHKGTLEPFRVAFEDLFMPLPSCKSEWPTLWNSIWRDPFSKLVSLPRDKVANQIRTTLSHFVVPSELLSQLGKVPEFDFQQELLLHGVAESDSALFEEEAIIIFIAPSYHLMMRFVMGKHTCVVWIATDKTELLLLLDEFFASWSAPTITDKPISA